MAKKKTAEDAREELEATGAEAEETGAEGADAADGESGGEGPEDIKEKLKQVIAVKNAEAGVLRRALTITVPADSLRAEFDKEFDELENDAIVPGFRKGRAPRRLIEKRFGRDVGSQVQTRLVSNAYLAAIEKEDLKVLGDPLVWVRPKGGKDEDSERLLGMDKAIEHIELPQEGDFSFRCEVELRPEIKLPALEGIPVEKPMVKIDDDDVEEQINRIRARRGSLAPVDEGEKIEEDDLTICDIKVSVDGSEIKSLENQPVAVRAQVVEGAVLSELGDALEGKKAGATVTATGELPQDYEVEELRGKSATFEFKINEVKRLSLPPLDANFLASQGFDSEDEFRAFVRDNMDRQLDGEIRRGMLNQIRSYLLDNIPMELPEGLSSRQAERTALRRMIDLQRQGVPIEEINKHVDELRTGAREQAISDLKLFFIMEQIAEQFEVNVSEEEINDQIGAMARMYNRRFDRVRDDLMKNDGLTTLYLEIRDEKCLSRLLETAKITEVSAPAKQEAKKAGGKKKSATKSESEPAESAESAEKADEADAGAAPKKKTAKKASRKKAD